MPKYPVLAEAYALLCTVPDERFTLSHVRIGAQGDASYWLAQMATFQALGLSVQREGGVYLHNEYVGCSGALSRLFDMPVSVAAVLFGPRRRREDDELSDKALQLARLRAYFHEYRLPTPSVTP